MRREQQTERFNLRLTPSEAKMAERLAAQSGLSMSDELRQALRRAYSERFGEVPTRPTTRARRGASRR